MRWLRRIVPLTIRGSLLAALAAGALAEGILRADLAGLFWGASILLVAGYFLAAGHLLRLALRRRRDRAAGILAIRLPVAGLAPGEKSSAHLDADLPRWFAPGLAVRFLLPLAWNRRSFDGVHARLAPGANEREIPFVAGFRGVYRSRAAVLEVGDVLGFTANRLEVPVSETLTVFPEASPPSALPRSAQEGGGSPSRRRQRRRTDELLEARKYVPGDDVRKLNWKIFAHMDQLFVRVGEETPPPDSRLLVLLDTAANPLVPDSLADEYLDRLVESCASAALTLLAQRVELWFTGPGVRECRAFTQESLPGLLALLADAAWAGADWAPDLPARRATHNWRAMHTLVFSSPGSPALRRILAVAAARGWSVSLFQQGLPVQPRVRGLSLRDILFVTPPQPAGPTRRQAAAFAHALAGDRAAYRPPAWKVSHAGET